MRRVGYESTREQREAITSQWEEFRSALAKATPRELPRTYGYEIETPSADDVRLNVIRQLRAQNLEREANDPHARPVSLEEILLFKSDGSVTREDQSEDCECSCTSCNYHDCNCDNCEDNNDSPEHDCGQSECNGAGEYQEITSVGGTTTTHPLSLKILRLADLKDAEVNDTCGLHIHVGSADLTPTQVAQVISAYRAIGDLLEPIAGRRDGYYCQDNTTAEVAQNRAGQGTEKYKAVNTSPHFSNHRPKTIEFRQHEGTNNPAEVRAFAVLMVHLVEYAKRNAPVYWLARCADFTELAKELRLTV